MQVKGNASRVRKRAEKNHLVHLVAGQGTAEVEEEGWAIGPVRAYGSDRCPSRSRMKYLRTMLSGHPSNLSPLTTRRLIYFG